MALEYSVNKNADPATPANKRLVRTGGLMRCCLASLAECDEPTHIGTTLSCVYESNPENENMIVAADGIWEWNR